MVVAVSDYEFFVLAGATIVSQIGLGPLTPLKARRRAYALLNKHPEASEVHVTVPDPSAEGPGRLIKIVHALEGGYRGTR